MSHDSGPAYGLWDLVVINSAVFILFAFSFFHPRSKRDWRSLGAFSAFILALFGVAPVLEECPIGKQSVAYTVGAVVAFRAVDCHTARNAARRSRS